jgi:hypothetical protein
MVDRERHEKWLWYINFELTILQVRKAMFTSLTKILCHKSKFKLRNLKGLSFLRPYVHNRWTRVSNYLCAICVKLDPVKFSRCNA